MGCPSRSMPNANRKALDKFRHTERRCSSLSKTAQRTLVKNNGIKPTAPSVSVMRPRANRRAGCTVLGRGDFLIASKIRASLILIQRIDHFLLSRFGRDNNRECAVTLAAARRSLRSFSANTWSYLPPYPQVRSVERRHPDLAYIVRTAI